jgi:hypothetical protein
VKSILSFNGMLTVLSNFPGEERFVRGLGPITLGRVVKYFEIHVLMRWPFSNAGSCALLCTGGDSDHEKRVEDLKMLYSAYAMEVLSDGHLNDDKLAALNQLRNIFGLAKYEAEAIITDVKARVFQTY